MKPGICSELSNAEYHSAEGVSSSDLKTLFATCPAKWRYKKENPEPAKDAWNLGTAVHSLILEPEKTANDIAVMPKIDRRTKAGKTEYAEFIEQSNGKTVVTADQWNEAQFMAEAVLNNPQAREALSDGKAEQSVFSVDELTGLTTKARPDYWTGSLLIDVKTTRDASPRGFEKAAANLGYHIQAAYYLDVCEQHRSAEDFLFICVESEAPYLTACYLADPFFIQRGREDYRLALNTLKHCFDNDEWPGYSPEIEYLSLPGWMK
jgi:hypothetical protein